MLYNKFELENYEMRMMEPKNRTNCKVRKLFVLKLEIQLKKRVVFHMMFDSNLTLECFRCDTLQKRKNPNPARNCQVPSKIISKRRAQKNKSRGSHSTLKVWYSTERERMSETALEEEEESSGQCVGRYSHGTFTFILLTHCQDVKILAITEYSYESESLHSYTQYIHTETLILNYSITT